MSHSPSAARTALLAFRQQLYATVLGLRQDSLFERGDALLSGAGPTTLVRHSLVPAFRRRWPSTCDALADGTVEAGPLRQLCVAALPTPAAAAREVWALDGTVWPRPHAATSPDRTYGYRAVAGEPQKHLVPGWEYQWLVALPQPGTSWVLPLDVRRRGPGGGTPTALALQQLRAVLGLRPPDAPRPVVTCDSAYAPGLLAEAHLPAALLVRLAKKRTLYRAPGPYRGTGARPKHGAPFKTHDPATHGPPDRAVTREDPTHGRVTVEVWTHLHEPAAPHAPFGVARVRVERLPGGKRQPEPLWLAWIGQELPADLLELWRWYRQRFQLEHGFRFVKHDLGWTTVRPQRPLTADRWTRLGVASLWQLWLARPLVADARLPWERPLAPEALTPHRVRRAFGALLPALGSPARAPQRRGKSPGRRPGTRLGPRPAQPVARRVRPSGPCRCPAHRPRPTKAA
jgi:hypothetical protein